MADPLVLKFDVETSRAKQGIADLAGSITNNMATVAAAMTGGAANTNKMGGALENLIGNARRAGLAVGTDILKIANDTSAAATKVDANLQGVASAFTKAALSSTTATQAMKTGFSTAGTAAATIFQQLPALAFIVEYKAALLAASGAVAIFSEALRVAFEQLERLQEIATVSRNAGVGSTFMQVWTAQANEFRKTAKEMEDALVHAREATRPRIGLSGQEELNPILQQLDEIRDASGAHIGPGYGMFKDAKDTEDRLKAIMAEIVAINKEAEKTHDIRLIFTGEALAEKAFGSKDFAKPIAEGKAEMDKLAEAARGAGTVFDTELVKKADDLKKQIEEQRKKMDGELKPLYSDLGAAAIKIKETWAEWSNDVSAVIVLMATLYKWVKSISDLIPDFKLLPEIGKKLAEVTGDTDPMKRLARGLESSETFARHNLPAFQPSIAGAGALNAGAVQYPSSEAPNAPGTAYTDVQPPRRPSQRELTTATPTVPKAKAESADEVDTYIKSLQKAVEVLEAENRTYGLGNIAKAEAVDLEKALAAARTRGTPLTEEERKRVKELADEEGRAKDKAEQLQKATEGANARANFLGEQALSVFERIGQSGVKARDVILDLAKAFEKAALQAVFLGSGPFANLFGTQGSQGNTGGLFGGLFGGGGLFRSFGFGGGGYGASDYTAAAAAAGPGLYGPGFAEGGLVRGGGGPNFIPAAALARARHFDTGGGVPAILHPGEIVLNQAQQKNVASGLSSGPKININHAPTINGTGLSADQLAVVLDKNNKSLARNIGGLMSDWQRRHG